MATKKRSKAARATASRTKTTARPRATAKAKATKKAAPRTVAKAKAKPVAAKSPAKPAAAKAPAAKAQAVDSPAVVALKSKFQRERSGLERRLTDAVREIGLLRHHELRAMQLERQLAERDATIGRLQIQLSELERRPSEAIYVREVQQTLALGEPAHDLETSPADLDEFEDERLAEDADLVSDDE